MKSFIAMEKYNSEGAQNAKEECVRFATSESDHLTNLSIACHAAAVASGWWHDKKTGELLDRNVGELLCLVHSEISEAMEADRKNAMDDHLPNRKGFEVELADALIRIFDLAGASGIDLAGAFAEKLSYNMRRKDHSIEARNAEGGKAY